MVETDGARMESRLTLGRPSAPGNPGATMTVVGNVPAQESAPVGLQTAGADHQDK
jgi:hypothetical protein